MAQTEPKKPGPIMALVGGILLVVGGFSGIGLFAMLSSLLTSAHTSWTALGIDTTPYYINFLITLAWGILGVVGSRLAKQGRMAGPALCFVAGIMSIVGLFIPISTAKTVMVAGQQTTFAAISLSSLGLLVDPLLLLIGGILSLINIRATSRPKGMLPVTQNVI